MASKITPRTMIRGLTAKTPAGETPSTRPKTLGTRPSRMEMTPSGRRGASPGTPRSVIKSMPVTKPSAKASTKKAAQPLVSPPVTSRKSVKESLEDATPRTMIKGFTAEKTPGTTGRKPSRKAVAMAPTPKTAPRKSIAQPAKEKAPKETPRALIKGVAATATPARGVRRKAEEEAEGQPSPKKPRTSLTSVREEEEVAVHEPRDEEMPDVVPPEHSALDHSFGLIGDAEEEPRPASVKKVARRELVKVPDPRTVASDGPLPFVVEPIVPLPAAKSKARKPDAGAALPRGTVKAAFQQFFANNRVIGAEALDALSRHTEVFFTNMATDLATRARKKKTVELVDMERHIRKQHLSTDREPVSELVRRYMNHEDLEDLVPVARLNGELYPRGRSLASKKLKALIRKQPKKQPVLDHPPVAQPEEEQEVGDDDEDEDGGNRRQSQLFATPNTRDTPAPRNNRRTVVEEEEEEEDAGAGVGRGLVVTPLNRRDSDDDGL